MSILYQYRELLRNLVAKDLKRKYRDSVLGFVWSLINPLCMIAVYNFAFKKVLNVPTPNYVLYLVVGILHWNLFAMTTLASTGCVRGSGGLIKKVAFPLEIVPLATVFFSVAQYLLAILVFAVVLVLGFDMRLNSSIIAFFPVLALQVAFIIGLSMLVSTAAVFYQDIVHFTELAFMLLFWVTPIVYEFKNIPKALQPFVLANPFTPFILAYQDIFVYARFPSVWMMSYIAFAAFATLTLGGAVFTRYKWCFAEEV